MSPSACKASNGFEVGANVNAPMPTISLPEQHSIAAVDGGSIFASAMAALCTVAWSAELPSRLAMAATTGTASTSRAS